MKKVLSLLIPFILFYTGAMAEPPAENRSIVHKKQCDSCHRFSKDMPETISQGPDLFFAGNKFQRNWLKEFLQTPTVIREAGYITDPGFLKGQPTRGNPHPALSEKEAEETADFLMALKIDGLNQGVVDDQPLSKGKKVRVKILFERNFGCTACHKGVNLAGKPKGGISGPSLVNGGNRLNADWIYNWLKNPGTFIGNGRMPLFNFDDETAIQLSKYIMTLKTENLR